jgi:hypothetical protein
MRAMSRIVVGPTRCSISSCSGLFQPSMNIARRRRTSADEEPDEIVDERGLRLRTSGR